MTDAMTDPKAPAGAAHLRSISSADAEPPTGSTATLVPDTEAPPRVEPDGPATEPAAPVAPTPPGPDAPGAADREPFSSSLFTGAGGDSATDAVTTPPQSAATGADGGGGPRPPGWFRRQLDRFLDLSLIHI